MKPISDSELPTIEGLGVYETQPREGPQEEYERAESALVSQRANVVRAAVVCGVVATLIVGAIGSWRRRRRARAPRIARTRGVGARVASSLAREVGTRIVLGAAGVLGARLASDVVAPLLAQRLAAAATNESDDEAPPSRDDGRARRHPRATRARTGAGRAASR